MKASWYWLCALVLLSISLAGCPVPIEFKQDAFDISGEYSPGEIKPTVGRDEVTPADRFVIVNETALYDVRMEVFRKNYTSLERAMFDSLPVSSEKDYLLKRILLSAGYMDPDSDLFESRENLSKDGGKTATITLASRYWQIGKGIWSKNYIRGDVGQILRCSRTEDGSGLSKREGNSCWEWIENARIHHQAFRYTFRGATSQGSPNIRGEFRLETKTLLQQGLYTIRVYSVMWGNELTLNLQKSADSNEP
jgi:hypothetical protein